MTMQRRDESSLVTPGGLDGGGWSRRDSSLVVPSHMLSPINRMISLAESVESAPGWKRRNMVRQLKGEIDSSLAKLGLSPRQRRKARRLRSSLLRTAASTLGEGSE